MCYSNAKLGAKEWSSKRRTERIQARRALLYALLGQWLQEPPLRHRLCNSKEHKRALAKVETKPYFAATWRPCRLGTRRTILRQKGAYALRFSRALQPREGTPSLYVYYANERQWREGKYQQPILYPNTNKIKHNRYGIH